MYHLLDESPLLVMPTLATKIGLNESIFLQQLHYWITINKKEERYDTHFRDDRWWAYNTYEEWQAKNFPFWSIPTIRRIVASLEGSKIVISAQYNDNPTNHTKWYSIDYDQLKKALDQDDQIDVIKMIRPSDQDDQIDDLKMITSNYTKTRSKTNTKTNPAPRQRDPIFDIVAICLFSADLNRIDKTEATRIGMVSAAFKRKYPDITQDQIAEWCEWHRVNKDYDLPLDAAKVLKHFGDWLDGGSIDISALPHDYDPNCPNCHGTGTYQGSYCRCYAPLLDDVLQLTGGNQAVAERLLAAYKKDLTR